MDSLTIMEYVNNAIVLVLHEMMLYHALHAVNDSLTRLPNYASFVLMVSFILNCFLNALNVVIAESVTVLISLTDSNDQLDKNLILTL